MAFGTGHRADTPVGVLMLFFHSVEYGHLDCLRGDGLARLYAASTADGYSALL